MWKCNKCQKPVFFGESTKLQRENRLMGMNSHNISQFSSLDHFSAERQQSLGFDWHPECLRCSECGKRLSPGQHAEHKGVSSEKSRHPGSELIPIVIAGSLLSCSMLWCAIWPSTLWPWNSSRISQELWQEGEGSANTEELAGPNHPKNSNRSKAQNLQSLFQQQKSRSEIEGS